MQYHTVERPAGPFGPARTIFFVPEDGRVEIHVALICGRAAASVRTHVATVVEPESVNPGVTVHKTLGANMLKEIGELVLGGEHRKAPDADPPTWDELRGHGIKPEVINGGINVFNRNGAVLTPDGRWSYTSLQFTVPRDDAAGDRRARGLAKLAVEHAQAAHEHANL